MVDLKLTGDDALIYAGLGYITYQYANIGLQHEEALNDAEAHAEQALELDSETAQASLELSPRPKSRDLAVASNVDSIA